MLNLWISVTFLYSSSVTFAKSTPSLLVLTFYISAHLYDIFVSYICLLLLFSGAFILTSAASISILVLVNQELGSTVIDR